MFNHYNVIFISIIIFLSFSQLFAQEINNKEISKKDSLGKNEFQLQNIYHGNLKGLQLVTQQGYNIQSQYFISDTEHSSAHFYFIGNNLSNFKKGMTQLLMLGYHDFTKYDLGVIGKYLGISKDIFAIILAILSTM